MLLAGLGQGPAEKGPADIITPAPAMGSESLDAASMLAVNPIPQEDSRAVKPILQAKAALLMDVGTGLILYTKNPNERLPMASLTKIMTAVIIMENHSLDEVVTVEDSFSGLEGVRMWLRKNEKITVGDLLIGLLVPSAGDAALALARYHSGSDEAFVNEMNLRARDLGLADTHFINPIGLDAEGHYSSAYDLAILTQYALRFPDFRRIVNTSVATVTSLDGKISHEMHNTNQLLNSYLDIRGVKTGTTDEAGESLINLAYHPDGHEVITVLLDSPDRFNESKILIDWAFRNFLW